MKSVFKVVILLSLTNPLFALANTKTYSNDKGCSVEVESRANGTMFYVTDSNKKTATVGLLNNLKNGNIFSFCKNVEIKKDDEQIEMSCSSQEESGAVATRGIALLDFSNGLSAIQVIGQIKGLLSWKTDTKIECVDLKLQ